MGPHPAVAEVRRAVRTALAGIEGPVLVACSGGADSLALAAATTFEAPRAGLSAGLVTVDHGLQPGSARAGARGRVDRLRARLRPGRGRPRRRRNGWRSGGGRARGALRGSRRRRPRRSARPCCSGTRSTTRPRRCCSASAAAPGPRCDRRDAPGRRALPPPLPRASAGRRRRRPARRSASTPWHDPHNADRRFQRVRLRREVLPLLEDVLQGGVAEALARTAALTAGRPRRARRDRRVTTCPPNGARPRRRRAWPRMPQAVRTRVLRRWATRAGVPALTADASRRAGRAGHRLARAGLGRSARRCSV